MRYKIGADYLEQRLARAAVQLMAPSGGVERPRRMVRFARLMQRPVRVLGGPNGPRRLRRHQMPTALRLPVVGHQQELDWLITATS